MVGVLFVCMGNYCRSPMAEAVFRDIVVREGLDNQFNIDSVGTHSYHVGDTAHPGTQRVLAKHGITCDVISRRVNQIDLQQTDYILVMDEMNRRDLQSIARGFSLDIGDRLHLLLDFASDQPLREVPDPYYTGDYEETYRLVTAGCWGLLKHIRQEHEF